MSFEDVRRILIDRLEEGDRGDRGWFIITRVHVALSWLKGIAEYIEARGSGGVVELTPSDYQRLATIIETSTADPGVQLRRHHLLVMDKPLQLLRRTNEPYWREVELTAYGRALALSEDPAVVLEDVLSEVRFASEPWCSKDRAVRYQEFDLQVYEVTKSVVAACDGYIDRDEFDFFVSRIRDASEIEWAIDAITHYRALASPEKAALNNEVKKRVPGDKEYANWRDIALHTFSLFSLGTSMVRDGKVLALTENWTAVHSGATADLEGTAPPSLKMPEPTDSEALLNPPSAPASNDGSDAESFVAKVFRSQGWTVAFYTNRRGFGFDLWAKKEDAAIVIEVKSSVGQLGSVTLTENEHRAAVEHGGNYVLALVEHLDSDAPMLRLIENPVEKLDIVERTATTYSVSRAEWLRAISD
jgi:hypothetical protein